MIEIDLGGQYTLENVDIALQSLRERGVGNDAAAARLRALVDAHHSRVWRLLRRLGVSGAEVDDAAQQVFIVAARRLAEIESARELQYLQGIAVRVASEHRRGDRRRLANLPLVADSAVAPPQPDELLDRKRAREVLDLVLDAMPFDLRAAFVLFELDELTIPEIAQTLDIPEGTASSRLRRAREEFRHLVTEQQKVMR